MTQAEGEGGFCGNRQFLVSRESGTGGSGACSEQCSYGRAFATSSDAANQGPATSATTNYDSATFAFAVFR